MPSSDTPPFFGEKQAATYDERFEKLAPLRGALHLLTAAVLAELPADARVLCVGAGTGAELLHLARTFPRWQFTAVDPSVPMLDVCRRKAGEAGVASRCTFHAGYLGSLPPAEPFHAATSILVSQFILDAGARADFYRLIAGRLVPDGLLVSADLASDVGSPAYQGLLEVWFRMMKAADQSVEQLEAMRTAYQRDVAVLPPGRVSALMAAGGFDAPVQFLQTGLIHAWYARRSASAIA